MKNMSLFFNINLYNINNFKKASNYDNKNHFKYL